MEFPVYRLLSNFVDVKIQEHICHFLETILNTFVFKDFGKYALFLFLFRLYYFLFYCVNMFVFYNNVV